MHMSMSYIFEIKNKNKKTEHPTQITLPPATLSPAPQSDPIYSIMRAGTVKPVCNDHLYNKIYYLWLIQ